MGVWGFGFSLNPKPSQPGLGFRVQRCSRAFPELVVTVFIGVSQCFLVGCLRRVKRFFDRVFTWL